MQAPHVGNNIHVCGLRYLAQDRRAVAACETAGVGSQMGLYDSAPQSVQMVARDGPVQTPVLEHHFSRYCRVVIFHRGTHRAHGTGKHVIIRVHERHVWVHTQRKPCGTPRRNVPLYARDDVHGARLVFQRIEALCQPFRPGRRVREYVDIDHQNVGKLMLYSSSGCSMPDTSDVLPRFISAPLVLTRP